MDTLVTEKSLMRAVVHDRYGPPEVLHLEEVERRFQRTTRC